MAAMLLRMLVIAAAAVVLIAPTTTGVQQAEPGHGDDVRPEYGWRRPPIPWWPTPSAPAPPPPPPPPVDPWWCNRTFGEEAFSGADDDDNPDCPPPPAPPTPPPPRNCPWPCLCPRFPPHRGPAPATTADCLGALAAVKSCGPFLTADDDSTPTLGSRCCTGIRTVLNGTTTSAAADTVAAASGGVDGVLHRCLCPLILGDVAGVLPKPADPLRLMYLPIACGFALPPQMMYICYSGRASAPMVGSFSELGH